MLGNSIKAPPKGKEPSESEICLKLTTSIWPSPKEKEKLITKEILKRGKNPFLTQSLAKLAATEETHAYKKNLNGTTNVAKSSHPPSKEIEREDVTNEGRLWFNKTIPSS